MRLKCLPKTCGKEITEEQDKVNQQIADESQTEKLDMCPECWQAYIYHISTGQ